MKVCLHPMSNQTISQLHSVKSIFVFFLFEENTSNQQKLNWGLAQYISAITALKGVLDLFVKMLDDTEIIN